jgi:hypothetical protein
MDKSTSSFLPFQEPEPARSETSSRSCVIINLTFALALITAFIGQALLNAAEGQVRYTVTNLHPPGSLNSTPLAINGLGDVVGFYAWKNLSTHSFFYSHQDQRLHDITYQGADIATGINNSGVIAGYA